LFIDDERVDFIGREGGLVREGTADLSNGTHGFAEALTDE
jgi:hypothetical protein